MTLPVPGPKIPESVQQTEMKEWRILENEGSEKFGTIEKRRRHGEGPDKVRKKG